MPKNEESTHASDERNDLRQTFGRLAGAPTRSRGSGCCQATDAGGSSPLYDPGDLAAVPHEVAGSSLGCGDAVTLAELRPGEVVLDLGSGAGLDCFLAARRVGETGRVIGVDMTPEMIEKANHHLTKVGLNNVEFRLGGIEQIPVEDEAVDVVLSNCVVNLSPDPLAVFREAYRVLKPGGRLAMSDVLLDRPLPEAIKTALPAGAQTLAGVLDEKRYVAAIEAAGFSVDEVRRAYLGGGEAPAQVPSQANDGGQPPRVRLAFKVGETGETIGELDPSGLVELAALPRSIRGNIRARKPGGPGDRKNQARSR